MPGTFTIDPPPIPLARTMVVPVVFLYFPDAEDANRKYVALPNVRVLSVDRAEGANPGVARCRYAFGDPYRDPIDPQNAEDVMPPGAKGLRYVKTDDRVAIRVYEPDGTIENLFDGFVQIPQASLGPDTEVVQFEIIGSSIREWDTPIGGATYRDGDDPTNRDANTPTDLPSRFNPDGKPNATQGYIASLDDDADVIEEEGTHAKYPIFLDQVICEDRRIGRKWTLGMAARYLMYTGNPTEDYVELPDYGDVDQLLESRVPSPDPKGTISPDDPSTYTDNPIEVQDLDVTGDPWPVALEKLIGPYGFGFRFELAITGDPDWRLRFYRKDTPTPRKSVYLQKAGITVKYDPAKTNVGSLTIQRDTSNVANVITLDTAPNRYEVGLVLFPQFHIAAGDADEPTKQKWVKGSPSFDEVTYREYGYSEADDGFWSFDLGSFQTTGGGALGSLLGKPDKNGVPQYTLRRRPAVSGKILSRDPVSGDPRPHELYLLTNWKGTKPALWDGTGNKQRVAKGGYELADEFLGIKLTTRDLENWTIGDPGGSGSPFPGGGVRVVSSHVNPDPAQTAQQRFWFLLICMIEGDKGLGVTADRRAASTTTFEITRRFDTRDRFLKATIDPSSPYYVAGRDPLEAGVRDDTDDAKAHAQALRKAHELATLACEVTIPEHSRAYQIGDRIDGVKGRNIPFRMNAAKTSGEGSTYPTIVSITWNFDGDQTTTLHLTERRIDPPPERRR